MNPIVLVLAAALQDVEARVSASASRFKGSMTFDERGQEGNRVDFEPDLGIVPGIEVSGWARPHRWYLEARRIALSGRETLEEDRRWNETLFSAGETVDMNFNWTRIRLGFEFAGSSGDSAFFGFGFGLRYDILRFALKSPAHGEDDDAIGVVSVEYGVVLRGAFARNAEIEAEFRGIYTDLLSDESSGAAAAMRVRWTPFPGAALFLGCEWEELSVVKDERTERNRLRYVAMGPMVGLAISF
jgi:hypothetical protein